MARKYNYIYKQLVEDKSDIVGHIAYSLYKEDKIQFINDFKEKNGREPNEGELKPFHDSSCLKSRLETYKESSVNILKDFLETTLSETAVQLENEIQADYINNVKKAVGQIPWWQRCLEGTLNSIIATIIIGFIVALIAFNIQFKDTKYLINLSPDKVHPEVIVPIKE